MNALLIFVRPPRPGAVKTRLAATVGNAEALRIYEFLLGRTRQAALGTDAERWLFYSEAPPEADPEWPEPEFRKALQRGDDLGDRMENAFRDVFSAGATRAVIVGSDCPELNGALIDRAFSALEQADFVLGPTPDGGYYLLGMNRLHAELFHDIAWSTDAVRSRTVEKINELDKTVYFLPELCDIDTEADWRAFEQRLLDGQPPVG